MSYWVPDGEGTRIPSPALFDGLGSPILIGRISCSLGSSFEVLFSFPLRYFFAIDCPPSYLALDGQHHPYSASTLKLAYSQRHPPVSTGTGPQPGSTAFASGDQPDFAARGIPEIREDDALDHRSRSPRGAGGFSLGLIPVRSQLLGESQLISFPPLTYMLKLGG